MLRLNASIGRMQAVRRVQSLCMTQFKQNPCGGARGSIFHAASLVRGVSSGITDPSHPPNASAQLSPPVSSQLPKSIDMKTMTPPPASASVEPVVASKTKAHEFNHTFDDKEKCVTSRARFLRFPEAFSNPENASRVFKSLADEDMAALSVRNEALRRSELWSKKETIVSQESKMNAGTSNEADKTSASDAADVAKKPNLSKTGLMITQDLDSLVTAIGAYGYQSLLTSVFDKLKPELDTHNYLIRSFAVRGNSKDAFLLVKSMMEKHGFQPNIDTYTHMITAYGNDQNAEEALKWFNVYRESDEPTGDGPYMSLVTAHVACGDVPAALNVMSHVMAEDSVPLTATHMLSFFQALVEHKEYQQAIDWYVRLKSDSSGQLPAINDSMRDVVFDAAVSLRNEALVNELFPTDHHTRSPSALSLSDYGLWKLLDQKDMKSAMAAFTALRLNKKSASPPMGVFLDALVSYLPLSAPGKQAPLQDAAVIDNNVTRDIHALRLAFEKNLGTRIMKRIFQSALENAADAQSLPALLKIVHVGKSMDSSLLTKMIRNNVLQSYTALSPKTPNMDVEDFELLFSLSTGRRSFIPMLKDFKQRGMVVTETICRVVMENMRTQKDANSLNAWIQEMRKVGAITGPRLAGELMEFEELIPVCNQIEKDLKAGDVDTALQRAEEIFATKKFIPTKKAMAALVWGLFAARRNAEASSYADRMIEISRGAPNERDRLVSILDEVVIGWYKAGHLGESYSAAMRLLNICDVIPHPDHLRRLLYSIAMPSKNKKPQVTLDEAALLVEECLFRTKLDPESCKEGGASRADLLSAILFVLSKAGKHVAALKLYRALRAGDITPRPNAMKELLSAIAKTGDRAVAMEILDDAMELVKTSNESSLRSSNSREFIDSSWFDPVIRMCIETVSLESAMSIWRLIKERKYLLCLSTLHILLEAHVNAGDIVGAVAFMKEFKRGLSVPADLTARILEKFDGELLKRVDLSTLCSAMISGQETLDQSIKPEMLEKLLTVLVDKDNHEYARLMTEKFLKGDNAPSTTLFGNSLIVYFCGRGNIESAYTVLKSMSPMKQFEKGNQRTMESVVTFTYHAAKSNDQVYIDAGLNLMSEDGFSAQEIEEVAAGVAQIRGKLAEHA
ncbi:hypothetical protein HDU80_006161 [Chytriomyces hyalinus]|nr:hypothetical protein HDU80_006161 [Chytriomyces hyalinus]